MLLKLSEKYKEDQEFIKNEEMTKAALVIPFLQLLGYDTNSPREVRHEYQADFTKGDGKRYKDRMDYAIFDKTGKEPRLVVEAKTLGSNLDQHSPQLARYLAQLPELHFGILTDGCRYLFFGDLDNPNVMDSLPFFELSLDEESAGL